MTKKTTGRMTRKTTRKARKKQVTKASGEPNVRFSDRLAAPLEEITRMFEENRATLDAIQDIALDVTRAAGVLAAVATKYVKMVNSVLDTAVPILQNIPLIPSQMLEVVTELEDLADNILDICTSATKVTGDVEQDLMNADVTKLQTHTGDLQSMTKALHKVLPAAKG